MARGTGRLVGWLFDVILRPGGLAQTEPNYGPPYSLQSIKLYLFQTLFFLGNVILFALPLALAGQGFVEEESAPSWFATIIPEGFDINSLWMIVARLINISSFFLALALMTFFTYHVGIWLTRNSQGIVVSYRIIALSTALYLAVIFNLGWVAVLSPQTPVAAEFINWSVREYFLIFADLVNVEAPFEAVEQPDLAELTSQGQAVLFFLILALCYYAYVLYQGARKSHQLPRYEAVLVVAFVGLTPIMFGTTTVIVTELFTLPDIITV